MPTDTANGDSRRSLWLRVREYAVPPSMIETATARRRTGDWAGACAAARFDVDLDLRSVARTHGRDLASRVRDDLRHLAPDLLRWHLPRIAPDGLLRPGLTVALARYGAGPGPVHLVARTAPAWADAGQRVSLALWDGARADAGAHRHPHPHPDRRFRLDLHRHLWDVRRTGELRTRSGAAEPQAGEHRPDLPVPRHCAVDRWADEARLLFRAEGLPVGRVAIRLGARRRLVLDLAGDGAWPPVPGNARPHGPGGAAGLPVLPDAATWVPPDLELLRAGLIGADRLHPLVAEALVPGHAPAAAPPGPQDPAGRPLVVECRGARHRIGVVDGVLVALDHDPAEVRREELLAALSGPPLPCLAAIDRAHRHPECLTGVGERLAHGDTAGALAVVESLLGPGALLRDGPLRDELERAARQRVTYGLYRADLLGPRTDRTVPDHRRSGHHPRRPRARRAARR